MKVFLFYNQFLSFDGKTRRIGGVQTYIEALAHFFLQQNIQPVICQYADVSFVENSNSIVIYGFPVKTMRDLYSAVRQQINFKHDLILFMSDFSSLKLSEAKTLSIQHGISWDIPYMTGNRFLNLLRRIRMIYRALIDIRKCDYRVCVDYNFYNWFKTFLPNSLPKNLWVIPNFATRVMTSEEFCTKFRKQHEKTIKIIFARRFEIYRGALLFAQVMADLLPHYPDVHVTLAGEGPCEGVLKEILHPYSAQVTFTRYLPQDSFSIHQKHDIAVIPTIGAEGTSLSLLEAMGAGCLVVATPIGGMSNIVIDGYNGLLTMPDFSSLRESLLQAINEIRTSDIIAARAVDTIASGFCLEKWEARWKQVLDRLLSDKELESR